MINKNLNIAFFGSSDFSLPFLDIAAKHFTVKTVYTQKPSKNGRGMSLTKTSVHTLAESLNINVKHPDKLTVDDANYLQSLDLDFLIVVSYGLILPQFVLDSTKVMPINVHPSCLPKYRGASPIQKAIENNDQNSSLCIIKMVKKLDAGDVLYRSDLIDITNHNSITLSNLFADLGSKVLVEVVNDINNVGKKIITTLNDGMRVKGVIVREVQNDSLSTYASKITKQDIYLKPNDLQNLTTTQTLAKIKAFAINGYLKTNIANKVCKIITAEGFDNNIDTDFITDKFSISKVVQAQKMINFAIKCSNGIVIPVQIIPENSKQIAFKDFINGIR